MDVRAGAGEIRRRFSGERERERERERETEKEAKSGS
jgi:hypothetical protein